MFKRITIACALFALFAVSATAQVKPHKKGKPEVLHYLYFHAQSFYNFTEKIVCDIKVSIDEPQKKVEFSACFERFQTMGIEFKDTYVSRTINQGADYIKGYVLTTDYELEGGGRISITEYKSVNQIQVTYLPPVGGSSSYIWFFDGQKE